MKGAVQALTASTLDERRLVDSHQAGDPTAFEEIVRAHYASLLGHANRRLHERHAAEDAVQETFLRAYRALPRFNGDYRLTAWLHRILENVCVDEGIRRRRATLLLDKAGRLEEDIADVLDPAMQFQQPDPAFLRAVASLPTSYREALLLRYVDELSYRDIASKTDITEENARARVHRARSLLRRMLTATAAGLAAFVATARRSPRALAESFPVHVESAAAQLSANGGNIIAEASAAPDRFAFAAKAVAVVVAVALPVGGIATTRVLDRPAARPEAASRTWDVAPAPADSPMAEVAPAAVIELSDDHVVRVSPAEFADLLDANVEQAPNSDPQGGSTTPAPSADPGPSGSADPTSQPPSDERRALPEVPRLVVPPVPVPGPTPATRFKRIEVVGPAVLALGGAVESGAVKLTAAFPTEGDRAKATQLAGTFDSASDRVSVAFEGELVSRTATATDRTYRFAGTYLATPSDDIGIARTGSFTAVYTVSRLGGSSLQLSVEPEAREATPSVNKAPSGAATALDGEQPSEPTTQPTTPNEEPPSDGTMRRTSNGQQSIDDPEP